MVAPPTPTRDAEYTAFVRSASASLTRTAYLLTGDRELAAELVQEALVRTYLAWRRVRHGEATAYARKVLVNLNIDRWRRCPAAPSDSLDRPDPVDAQQRVDDRDEVVRLLAELPPQQRRVIVLRYFNDLTEADVAQCLGISVGAVKSAASRGLASLRTRYAPVREGGLE
jgi:RNA polymerase sigma-70 factor (sigma-E family)